MRLRRFLASIMVLGVFAPTSFAQELWPQWRGPERDCKVPADSTWPATLNGKLTERYRVPLGESYSGPIVTESAVFVTETVKGEEVVRALDRASGQELWKVSWPDSMTVPFFAASNGSWVRSTPAFYDGKLYVTGMEDVLVCLDAATGSEVWRVDFRQQFGTSNQSFGFVCSPLIHEDKVIVQVSAGLVALNRVTGEVLWRSLNEEGGMMGGAFSSPIVTTILDQLQLVVQTREKLCGVNPSDGQVLWTIAIPSFRGMNILTPTVIGNRVFTSSYGGGTFLYEIEKTADGSLQPRELWKAKSEAYMSSPTVWGDNIYMHLRNQRFTCVDALSGETKWTTKPYGKYWSMAVNGDQALVLDERGDLLLVKLNPGEFTLIDEQHVSDAPTWAHLAVVDQQVYVRALDSLIVYDWQ